MTDLLVAHLTDPHLGPVPWPGWRALANKRLTGYLSWTRNRRHIHTRQVLDLVVADLVRAKPDHIVVTGDLANISLPEEFLGARAWLEHLGGPDRVTIIPGNHDNYVALPWSESLAHWSDFMGGIAEPGQFPFCRLLPDLPGLAIIGVSSAIPMPPFIAAGKIGAAQAERLAGLLAELGRRGLFRLILIHHPPFAGGAYKRKSLLDADRFRAAIAKGGAELVLHGHMHVASLGRLATPAGIAPVIGGPSASALPHHGKDPGGYYLHRLRRLDRGWEIASEGRSLSADGRAIVSAGTLRFRTIGDRPQEAGAAA